MCEAFNAIVNNYSGDCVDCMYECRNEMIECTKEQLLLGLEPDGEYISPRYNPFYASFKATHPFNNPKRPHDVPNLSNEGLFRESIFCVKETDGVSFDNTDKKWETAISKSTPLHGVYGDVLGVTEENLFEKIAPLVKTLMQDRYKKRLGI